MLGECRANVRKMRSHLSRVHIHLERSHICSNTRTRIYPKRSYEEDICTFTLETWRRSPKVVTLPLTRLQQNLQEELSNANKRRATYRNELRGGLIKLPYDK